MPRTSLRFETYDRCADRPNVVVDGSPTPATTLLLTHWPGYPAPAGLARDLSAQMALAYLTHPDHLHGEAELVTNNHFDQDGVASLLALTRPDVADRHGELLADVASAGDFAVTRTDHAAQLSMAIAALADPGRTPLSLPAGESTDAILFPEALDRLPAWLDDAALAAPLWEEEYAALVESRDAIAGGRVEVAEHDDVDLAVVTLAPDTGPWSGHRFCGRRYAGLHPNALHELTLRSTVLLVHGATVTLTCRYEGWVQFCTRPIRARRDLRPLAEQLTSLEPGAVTWTATGPGDLTPELQPVGGGTELDPATIAAEVRGHLATAPPAWDPYVPAGP